MASVHEVMHQRAEEQENVRKRTKDVSAMFLPKKEHSDREKHTESQPKGDPKRALHLDSPFPSLGKGN
jgi:hypothetical protein